MKKILFHISLLSFTGLLFFSCADEKGTDSSEFTQGVFDRWMTKYHPEATKMDGKYAGLYTEWIEQDPEAVKPREGYWIKLNYTASDQYGNIFRTRSEEMARQLGFFPKQQRLNYLPELIQYNFTTLNSSGNYPWGQLQALSMMGVGDSLRVYMPPYMGFLGSGYSYISQLYFGYSSATTSVSSNSGIICDMKILEIIKDLNLYETEQVQQFAQDSLGITNMADTLISGAYMKKYIVNEKGDSVKKESTVKAYFVGRYLDGFVFDTNVKSVAEANGIKGISGEPTEWNLSVANLTEGFETALLNMQAGEHARVVLVSLLGYGKDGLVVTDPYTGSSNLIIPPYTPLEFEIWIESVEYPAEEEDDKTTK